MQVAPILAQPQRAVRTYIEETGLPFDILVDESRDVLRAYGVWQKSGWLWRDIARPALFLVDRDRGIRYSFIADRQDQYPSHEEIVEAISGSA